MKHGGPAFPQPKQGNPNTAYMDAGPGMSLRDWFAGQALAGSAGNSREMEYFEERAHQEERTTIAVLAEHSYMIADAMLKAREESNG